MWIPAQRICFYLALLLPSVLAAQEPAFRSFDLPAEKRAADLVSRLTLEEKVLQMQNSAPAIPRLGIPSYDWWNEALHGVARAGLATSFPQAIGLAATWDAELMFRVADVISTEARAKYNEAVRMGDRRRYHGLTFWSPNINIFRDPRWGRGQETYGEDPFLTARLAVAFIRGMQGNDPRYWKTIATPKHFAVHSGPERLRHAFDARPSTRDLEQTYLPAFRASIVEAGAGSIMCAYNRVDGAPACASNFLLEVTLRRAWKFQGYVVSDCGAVYDIVEGHKVKASMPEAAALAVKAGTDLTCGDEYKSLVEAVQRGLISESDIDRALTRLFTARIRLGLFDPDDRVPFAKIPYSENDSPAHRQLALEAARKSIVLLKNENGILPLKENVRRIAVIGPAADDAETLLGNYNGRPSHIVTPLEGMRRQFAAKAEIRFAMGSAFAPAPGGQVSLEAIARAESQRAEAVQAVSDSDVVVAFLGLNPRLEGEEMPVEIPGFSGGDRTSLDLPEPQEKLLQAIIQTGKPVVVVLISGSALAVNYAQEHAAAVLAAWYGGEEGGTAIALTVAGENNPAGRLPVTFYRSVSQLPPFEDYAMRGRTYRYFTQEPLYPFGYGLSYSSFRYSDLRMRPAAGEKKQLQISVRVANSSRVAGEEVVQLYVGRKNPGAEEPVRELCGFQRVYLKPGESRIVKFELNLASLSFAKERPLGRGELRVSVGGGQSLGTTSRVEAVF